MSSRVKKKTVYCLRIRAKESQPWGSVEYYRTRKERDVSESMNRVFGGFRTHSFEENKTEEEISNLIDPIEPVECGKLQFAIDGNKLPIDAEMIPKLFVAYVAAKRAQYYAGVDAARCDSKQAADLCFEDTFRVELRHALGDRTEIKDWMDNNMDPHLERCDEIGVLYIPNK